MFDDATENGPGLRIAIAHADAPEWIEVLTDLVAKARPQAEIELVENLGAVVGTHAGPGAVGFFWFQDDAVVAVSAASLSSSPDPSSLPDPSSFPGDGLGGRRCAVVVWLSSPSFEASRLEKTARGLSLPTGSCASCVRPSSVKLSAIPATATAPRSRPPRRALLPGTHAHRLRGLRRSTRPRMRAGTHAVDSPVARGAGG